VYIVINYVEDEETSSFIFYPHGPLEIPPGAFLFYPLPCFKFTLNLVKKEPFFNKICQFFMVSDSRTWF